MIRGSSVISPCQSSCRIQYKDNLEFGKPFESYPQSGVECNNTFKAPSVHPPNRITALNDIMLKLTMLKDGTVGINMKE